MFQSVPIRILCIITGYCFGLIQTAYIYGRLNGIDIRNEGSGNAGATNALRVLGKKAGITVFAGDVCKMIAAVFTAKFLIIPKMPEITYLLILYTGFGVILGHNFPCYLNFRGGKGIAATAGLIIVFSPWLYIPCLLAFIIPFVLTKYVSLGSLCVYFVFVLQIILMGENGFFERTGMPRQAVLELYILAIVLMAMAYIRHRTNIVNIIKGCERKTSFKKKV